MRRLAFAMVLGLGGAIAACGNSSSATGDDGGGGGGDDQPGDDAGGGSGGGGTMPHTVKLTLTNRPNNAGAFSFVVAYQDGGAAWQLAPAPTGDTYSLPIYAPSYGVAFTCIGAAPGGGGGTQTRLVTMAYFAVGERTELTLDVPARCTDRNASGAITLTGSVTNRPFTGGPLTVVWGGRTAIVGGQSGTFQLQAPAGTHDLFVLHGSFLTSNGSLATDEVWVERNVTLNASAMKTIDFSDAQPTQSFTVDMGNTDFGARVTTATTVYTANGTQATLVRDTQNRSLAALADAQMATSDVYDQFVSVAQTGRAATVTHATNTPGDLTWTAPAPLGMVSTMSATDMPYVTLESTWPAYASVTGYTWAAAQQLTGSDCGNGNTNSACTIAWTASLSPGVTGAMPAFRMPDLSGLTGWKSAFELASGQPILGSVTAYTSSAGASDFPAGVPANGTVRTFVRSDFALSP